MPRTRPGVSAEPAWTPDEMAAMLRSVRAVNQAAGYLVWIWCEWDRLETLKDMLVGEQMSSMQPFYWHKSDDFSLPVPGQYHATVETALLVWVPTAPAVNNMMVAGETIATKQNYVEAPAVRQPHKFEDGERVCAAQKNPDVYSNVMFHYLVAGDTVLVIRAGGCSEMEAAIRHGCNVVAVEPTKRRADFMNKYLLQWDAQFQKIAPKTTKKTKAISEEPGESDEGCIVCGEVDVPVQEVCLLCAKIVCQPCMVGDKCEVCATSNTPVLLASAVEEAVAGVDPLIAKIGDKVAPFSGSNLPDKSA